MRYIFKNKFYKIFIAALDAVGYVVMFPFRHFPKKNPEEFRNILLIRLDHIGDVIYATSVPKNIKEKYPNAKVTFMVGSWARDIIAANPYIDEVACYDAPWFDRKRQGCPNSLKNLIRLIKKIREDRYDLGVDLRGDFRHIAIMALAGVKFRLGYGITGGGFLLHQQVRYRPGVHAIEHNLDLLSGLGLEAGFGSPQLYVSTAEESVVENLLRENNIKNGEFIAVIHPAAGYPSKNWDSNRFADLMRRVSEKYRAKVFIAGSAKDINTNNYLVQESRVPAVNVSGKISLGVLLALLKKSDIFIGVDSGPAHIAACAGIPAIVLYSGTNRLSEWGPLGKNVTVIQKDTPCKECERPECEKGLCMELITVDEVMRVIGEVLKI